MLKLKLGKIPRFTLKEKTQGDSHFTKKYLNLILFNVLHAFITRHIIPK